MQGKVASWRRMATHQEARQQERLDQVKIDTDYLESLIDNIMAIYTKAIIWLILPGFILYVLWHMWKAGLI